MSNNNSNQPENQRHSKYQHSTEKVGEGILIRTLIPGDATNYPRKNDTCRIHYETFLINTVASTTSSPDNSNFDQRQKIDSSIDREEPLLFRLYHDFAHNSNNDSSNPITVNISNNRNNQPNERNMNIVDVKAEKLQVLPGLDVAVGKMSLGQKAEIIIPPLYAYGDEGYLPVIPPKATLVFVVELLNFSSLQ